jgi:GntR family negative regulator for fad regulon and positive regulator of fabA
MDNHKKFVKPAQFAEKEIIKAIVNQQLKNGDYLPPERELATKLGITRPTLREVLQRLARDGWITINHGRPTIINDFKNKGGLGVLKTLARFNEFMPNDIIRDWLEFRALILPELAYKAILANPDKILDMLKDKPKLNTSGDAFATFDWDLQMLMINNSNNSIAKMLYNDLTELYHQQGATYFDKIKTRRKSLKYYRELSKAIHNKNEDLKAIIEHTMHESLTNWHKENKQLK